MDELISRQAAIDALSEQAREWDFYNGSEECLTKEEAIGCIKQLPPANCSEFPNNSDTISRQAAIDALRKMQTYKLFSGDDMLLIDQAGAMTELMLLPPADVVPVVRCKDCKFRDEDAFLHRARVSLPTCARLRLL